MVLLDTCALLWWTLDPEKLSPAAARACSAAARRRIAASSISIWEIGVKVRKKKLVLPTSFRDYVNRLQKVAHLELLPVTAAIWARSVELRWDNRDPADRVIVATASLNDLPIVTKDDRISSCYRNAIW
jgi:PIN domain nuclease of toxin-antitoxin system